MNVLLRQLDGLRPDELVWLHAYLTGRVHALTPATYPPVPLRPGGVYLGILRRRTRLITNAEGITLQNRLTSIIKVSLGVSWGGASR